MEFIRFGTNAVLNVDNIIAVKLENINDEYFITVIEKTLKTNIYLKYDSEIKSQIIFEKLAKKLCGD